MLTKDELKNIISGKSPVKHGNLIQTIANYLRGSEKTGAVATGKKPNKKEETERLKIFIEENNLWFKDINMANFVSEGAEQKVFLANEEFVIKLNDAIYYESWQDYFHNLLLNNYFFPDTAYELLGFYKDNKTLYAVVRQNFVKADEPTDIENVKQFLMNNKFTLIRNNDYKNEELGIIFEDLHDENVLTQNGVLFFIDTVFYSTDNF